MPPPVSYIDITAVPFSQLVAQADFNAGTYGGVAKQTWFRRVTAASVVLGVHSDRGGTFDPVVTVYQSNGSTVIGSHNAEDTFYVELPTPGTYYIKVDQAGVSDFDFTFLADERPLGGFTIPPGALIINDDRNGPPASVMQLDGTIVGFLPAVPSGEIGAALFTGETIWQDRYNEHGAGAGSFSLFDDTGTYVTSVNPAAWGSFHTPAAASETDFYVVYKNTARVYKITPAGVVTGPIATLVTGTPNLIFSFGVSRDGTIAYWSLKDGVIHSHDLVGDTALPDPYSTGSDAIAVSPNNLPGELLVLPDGTIVTWIHPGVGFGADSLIHLAADGTLLHGPYTFTGTYLYVDHLTYADQGSDRVTLWRLADPNLDSGRFSTFELATGVESTGVELTLFTARVNLITDDPTLVAPSESCSFVMFLPPAAPVVTTLIVQKVVEGGDDTGQTFPITVTEDSGSGVGLLLTDGAEESLELEPGTYAVAETDTPGWTFVGIVVDNGDPGDAIVLEAGDTVTAVVTNVRAVSALQIFKFAEAEPLRAFTILVGPDLTPTSLALRDQESYLYEDLAPGVYSVAEIVPTGWSVAAVVSNGSPLDAITVAAGETVTVWLTNTLAECECCVATQIALVNQALLKLGHSQTIEALDDSTREAMTAGLIWSTSLRAALRRFPWAFATKYASAVDDIAGYMDLVGGTPTEPYNTDWTYAYRYPVDALFARRLVNPATKQGFDPDPYVWRVGRDDDGWIVYTDIADAVLEYTALVECLDNYSDDLFEDALSWLLASKLAPSLARNKITAAECLQLFEDRIAVAATVNVKERQLDHPGEAEWIRNRE